MTKPAADRVQGQSADVLVLARQLTKEYPIGRGRSKKRFRAVDSADFEIKTGTTLGLVGESGSGKSTTAMMVAGLLRPTSGEILVLGQSLRSLGRGDLRRMRRNIQVVFQDPHSSLDPRMSVERIIAEPLYVHGVGDRNQRRERVRELLDLVGMSRPYAERYPHQLSGGQAQRVSIARALALEPQLIVLDEPVASLDLSIQAQILNLLRALQKRLGLTYLFIGHDLGAVAYVSDTVAVMHNGVIVESGTVEDVYLTPREEYTKKLLDARLDPIDDIGRYNERSGSAHAR